MIVSFFIYLFIFLEKYYMCKKKVTQINTRLEKKKKIHDRLKVN